MILDDQLYQDEFLKQSNFIKYFFLENLIIHLHNFIRLLFNKLKKKRHIIFTKIFHILYYLNYKSLKKFFLIFFKITANSFKNYRNSYFKLIYNAL